MVLLKIIGAILLAIVIIILAYLTLGFLGSLLPVNRKYRQATEGPKVYLKSDGIHTDFVLPSINDLFDWSKVLDAKTYAAPISKDSFLAFGWGDKGFYLEIPTWSDLTPQIAFKAMCVPSPTCVHVIAYPELPTTFKYFEALTLTEQQYLDLCNYILEFFKMKNGQIELIPDVGYTPDDNFYLANSPYHAFHTCNYWVNRGLKRIGVKTAFWSPGAVGIFRHLK